MADGFLGGKNREDILRIMRDSHVGTMGMIAVVSLMLAKLIFLYEVLQIPNPHLTAGALLLIPGLSRWGMVIAAGVSRYARDDFGLGRAYTEGVGKKIVVLSCIVPVIAAAAYFRIIGGFCIIITIASALVVSWISKRKISGVTGDVLGGINEITEAILFLSMILFSKI
jgi:adenosylcobinamide-GDP ribazoletransferase